MLPPRPPYHYYLWPTHVRLIDWLIDIIYYGDPKSFWSRLFGFISRLVCNCHIINFYFGSSKSDIGTSTLAVVTYTSNIGDRHMTRPPRANFFGPTFDFLLCERARSAIVWGLYTEGRRSEATERLGLGSG